MKEYEPKTTVETELAVISNNVSWIRKEFQEFKKENKAKVDAEIACRKRWQQQHEEDHKGLVGKLVASIVIITSTIGAFIGKLMH